MNALAPSLDLAPALVVLPGPRAAAADAARAEMIRAPDARDLFEHGPVLVAHAGMTAKRLGVHAPSRSQGLFDALELFAFVRPARFCAPSAAGLALALGLPEPKGAAEQAKALREACHVLLAELALTPEPSREEALAIGETLARAGWAWGTAVIGALRSAPVGNAFRGSGMDVWTRVAEWEEQAPPGEAGSRPIAPEAAAQRLTDLLRQAGLDEARPTQAQFAAEAAFAFSPREKEGEPRMMLAEAGTGVGKTLGYLAPASLWAEANGPAVWISTYTRALQRQIERESHAIYPDPKVRAKKAVVRKGRENYLCLLNFQDQANTAQLGGADLIGLALTARWVRATRDGDMTGGDFPAWLPTLFAVPPVGQASAANLVDRRGECIHAGCAHYRTCFVEKAVRGSRRADIVIANHALVLTQAAFDGARAARGSKADGETTQLKRIVFDEGHHLFDAADAAFAAALSGAESAELRRWIRGPEGRGRRGRGLEARLMEVLGDRDDAKRALVDATRAAAALPGEGWSGRVASPNGEVNPMGPIEHFVVAIIEQLRARSAPSEVGMECAARPALDLVRETARAAALALAAIEAPLLALARHLEDVLDDEAATLPPGDRARIEGALRGLDRRARMTLPAWRSMLRAIDEDAEDDPDFVDWFDATFLYGRVVDAACRRHWVDPTEPLTNAVIAPAHGVLVTSATLADSTLADPFALAEMRTGAARLPDRPKTLRLASPFDYETNSRAFVVTDVGRDDPRQVAAAMRELFLAAGGGGVGLFTAIRRLRAVHEKIAAPLSDKGLALYAQHVDPLEVGALVDIFRAEQDSCLLGTDAVRDGVDVPGRSLRLLVFDRVPWPRPDILHKARRVRFGGKAYDDSVARNRISQAFGRLIRRADDKGVFVMLDAAAPTRLFSGLPEGVKIERLGLVEAIEATAEFLGAP
ncbi:MAG: ATP-dependent DNA helicase [Phenylobacterium sp.]|uniref:ATP-dependent DNA helicase n=1 Tax=Phenylobacterium sp. TaxID=1871053 RepID=UPI001B3F1AF8|nr:ATP-dependent DNA helicase [Phenylobacterium sp.]MBP7650509.1 ATP-dependent DNA helicase [Phenylobacterium sp.]MBP7816834.1 ATP-dependent DNA helicase [Phenylobacterium sp.]MBP9230542.1 ATP-dependent DNA helicase [Phenylobacterium sp.]